MDDNSKPREATVNVTLSDRSLQALLEETNRPKLY
jgi:hypothetical protein